MTPPLPLFNQNTELFMWFVMAAFNIVVLFAIIIWLKGRLRVFHNANKALLKEANGAIELANSKWDDLTTLIANQPPYKEEARLQNVKIAEIHTKHLSLIQDIKDLKKVAVFNNETIELAKESAELVSEIKKVRKEVKKIKEDKKVVADNLKKRLPKTTKA